MANWKLEIDNNNKKYFDENGNERPVQTGKLISPSGGTYECLVEFDEKDITLAERITKTQ